MAQVEAKMPSPESNEAAGTALEARLSHLIPVTAESLYATTKRLAESQSPLDKRMLALMSGARRSELQLNTQ
jgi:hypothetical protein